MAVVIALVVVALPGAVCLTDFTARLGIGAVSRIGLDAFYRVPTSYSASRPGDIVKIEPIAAPPPGSRAWRILYLSTDEQGRPAVVSGTVIAPTATAGAAKRTVVSWGHPTSGIEPRCAPSVGIDPFIFVEGLRSLLAHGYVVVATDYSGMGAIGPPSFLLGDVEGANMLDIVRAAQAIPAADAGTRVLLWGHSQGGQAALFAAQRAATYAPDLDVLGVAVAAPATDLGALMAADLPDISGVTIGSYAFTSYSQAYKAQLPDDALAAILTPAARKALPGMARLCLFGQNSALHSIAAPLVGGFVRHDPATDPLWGPLLAANSPSAAALPVPLFIAQGAKDTLVRPAITARYVSEQRRAGATVTSHVYLDATHATIALDAVPKLISWMSSLQ